MLAAVGGFAEVVRKSIAIIVIIIQGNSFKNAIIKKLYLVKSTNIDDDLNLDSTISQERKVDKVMDRLTHLEPLKLTKR